MFQENTKILVVDDMSTMRKLIIKQLKELSFKDFIESEDGSKAWEVINADNPRVELVISDWNMPHSTGIDLIKRIRADSRFIKLPFLMVTAEAEKHQIIEALKSGVSGYILKPFVSATLKEQLILAYQKFINS